jgi:hypothetical protein
MKTTSSLSPAKRSSSGSPSKSMKRGICFLNFHQSWLNVFNIPWTF